MEQLSYKQFSLKTHKLNWKLQRPNVCQFELTFGCGLHCRHCYTDCYNKPSLLKTELKTNDVLAVLDKIYDAGVVWLCFTGGDPLTRGDFLKIYAYAKQKGFIISIFTNGYSMSKEIAQYLSRNPPFVIEITFNAATRDLYDSLTQVSGSFEKTVEAIALMQDAGLKLKVKAQVTKDNIKEIPGVKKFLRTRSLRLRTAVDIFARLDGDTTPCTLRLPLKEALRFNREDASDCRNQSGQNVSARMMPRQGRQDNNLFRCAAGSGDGIYVDPYGNAVVCNLIRKPAYNLLKVGVTDARTQLRSWVRGKVLPPAAKCRDCGVREYCLNCPGKAWVETGGMDLDIGYFCKFAQAQAPAHLRSRDYRIPVGRD